MVGADTSDSWHDGRLIQTMYQKQLEFERLYMTEVSDGGQSKKAKVEDPFFEKDVPDPNARLNDTGSVFSNLLNELEKMVATTQT